MSTGPGAPPAETGAPAERPIARAYYSISQAAALLGVSRVSIWRWIGDGCLPAARLGHRTTRIMHADLERLLVQREPAGVPSQLTRTLAPGGAAVDGAAAESVHGAPWRALDAGAHIVQFYETDTVLLDAVGAFIGPALRAGDAGIVVATAAHRAGLADRLQAAGLDVSAARDRGRYVALDADETLARLIVDGALEPGRFATVIGDIVARAAVGGRRVRIFGEMVALLALRGDPAVAVRLEELWNDLQQSHAFALFCAYPMACLGGEAWAGRLGAVCAAHSQVIPAESYTALPTADERLRAIAVLQQRAESLDAAVAAERAARASAAAALRRRDEFLSIAAHELKTPLTSLAAQAQVTLRRLTRDGQVEPEGVAQVLQVISGQAGALSRLIDQLLDVARLETGTLTLERQPSDLVALVEQVVAGVRAWSARHTITLDLPPTLEAWVDPLRLEQVVLNLLDNAIKDSPDGGPIEVVLCQRGPTAADLSVRDRGLGILPEKQGQISPAHSSGHRSGLGLGLYVSRQIVELHGGEIAAEFPADGGARFVVHLPLAGEEQAAPCAIDGTRQGIRVGGRDLLAPARAEMAAC